MRLRGSCQSILFLFRVGPSRGGEHGSQAPIFLPELVEVRSRLVDIGLHPAINDTRREDPTDRGTGDDPQELYHTKHIIDQSIHAL